MFGLSIEKIVVIVVLAAILIGPERLPQYSRKLAELVRYLKRFASSARERVRDEMGPEFDDVDWKKLDPRQYDPRRIIRDALFEDDEPSQPRVSAPTISAPKQPDAGGASSAPVWAAAASTALVAGRAPFDDEAT